MDGVVETPPEVFITTCSPAPAWKPLPLMVSVWLAPDLGRGFGLSEVIAGPVGGAFTVRLAYPERPPGFVTVMVHVRAVVPTLIDVAICVAERVPAVRLVEKPV